MSGEPAGGNRTQPPTPRRLREARKRGEVAHSRELSAAAALAGGLVAIAGLGPFITSRLAAHLRWCLTTALAEAPGAPAAIHESLWIWVTTVMLIGGAALVTGGLAAALQVGGIHFSPFAVTFRLERLNPINGWRRIFSFSQIGSVALGLAKGTTAGLILWHFLSSALPSWSQLPRLDPRRGLAASTALLSPLICQLCAAFVVFGLIDLLWAHRRHRRSLLMTHAEVLRDHREEEGDPYHKAERQRRHRALVTAEPVSKATCVVVNPTHVAVALWHRHGSDDAPVVLAKGSGDMALQIRRHARRAGVPVVREAALARALYRLAEVGDEIPEELYEAAAVVLVHVYGASPLEAHQ